ncbi:MAG TPA: copper resistance protein CopC [Ktedonobacteraceae bacterium]|nr:copper resistance protein CopC [Ktedonobacteraceae bacterium]
MHQQRFFRRRWPVMVSASLLLIYLLYLWSPVAPRESVAYAASTMSNVAARAFVIGSDPVDGATIATVPKVVRIFFNEDISPISSAHIYVFDTTNGREVNAARSYVSPTNTRELDTPLANPAQLPQGIYEVKWLAVGNADGQVTTGLIGFNVGHGLGLQGTTILGPTTSNNPVQMDFIGGLSIAWEWLLLVALTFWVGILVVEGLLLGNDAEARASGMLAGVRKQSIPLQWLCLSAFLVGEIVILLLRSIALSNSANSNGGINFGAIGQVLFATNYGILWIVRIVLVIVALLLLRWSYRKTNVATKTARLLHGNGERADGSSGFSQLRQRVTQEQRNTGEQPVMPAEEPSIVADTRGYTIIGLVLAGLLLLTFAWTSDAVQLSQLHISVIELDWLYLAARSIWLGSLAYLGYVLLPLLPNIEQDRQAKLLTAMLRRFHPLLLGTVSVLLVSGLYLSESSIFDAHQLTSDAYGRSLLVTLVLVGLILLLSAYIVFVLRPKLGRQAALLPVIDAELPTRRTRQSALEQTVHSIKKTTTALSWLGAGIMLCAALMAFFAPPIVFPTIDYATAANNSTALPPGINAQTEQVGNLSVTLQVSPGRSGYANTVILTINDSNGNPVTDAQVQLTTNMVIMDMGTAQVSIAGGNPTYIATFSKEQAFSMSGLWDITVKIQRPHQSPVQTIFQVSLNA